MRVHRVYLSELSEGETHLSGGEAQHLVQVLRVQAGAAVLAFDGKGHEAQGKVVSVDGLTVILNLSTSTTSPVENPVDISLAVALLKGDKLSGVVRQATELGVTTVQLFHSRHSDVKEISKNKLGRLRRVATEAAKQSGRSLVPDILEPSKLADLTLSAFTLCAHPYASATLNDLLSQHKPTQVTLLTGPEGGFHEDEIDVLREKGANSVSLGPRILRAETAPVALLAALVLPEGQ